MVAADGSIESSDVYVDKEEAERENLCMDGHLVPEFFLLGAQKTSTSTLAANLNSSHDIIFPVQDGESVKELHFFSDSGPISESMPKAKQLWLSYYPRCYTTRRAVSTDCTPSYIRESGAAHRIVDFYGALTSKLTFALMLRSPLERAQSSYYHQVAHGRNVGSTSFSEFTRKYLTTGFDVWNVMWGSQYPPQLEEYFKVFDSGQFWIAPYRCNFEPSLCGMTTTFTETLWTELAVAPGVYDDSIHISSHPHPSIEDDLDSNTLKDARDKFASIAPSMAKLLASSDAKLFGYSGKTGDEEAIKTWLTNGW